MSHDIRTTMNAIIGFTDLFEKNRAARAILAMTANAFAEDKREALKADMDGHLAKPVNVRELMKALSAVLRTEKG